MQGTGADGLKLALLYERRDECPGAVPILAVHDEIVVECDEGEAEKVEAQLLKERRRRVLPSEADLQTIARYEAHLSRQMYQALHELEALQARRRGRAAPLARMDVQT